MFVHLDRWRPSCPTALPFGPLRPGVGHPRAAAVVRRKKWRLDGRLRRAHDRLRTAVREVEGRDRDPSAAVVDSQVVKTTQVGGPERGYDGAKRLSGHKRYIQVDTGGLVLAARVHRADLPDRHGGRRLLGRLLE